jgi:hypothetical protein
MQDHPQASKEEYQPVDVDSWSEVSNVEREDRPCSVVVTVEGVDHPGWKGRCAEAEDLTQSYSLVTVGAVYQRKREHSRISQVIDDLDDHYPTALSRVFHRAFAVWTLVKDVPPVFPSLQASFQVSDAFVRWAWKKSTRDFHD